MVILNEWHQKYLRFYAKLISQYTEAYPRWEKRIAQPLNWMELSADREEFRFIWAFRPDNRFSTALNVNTKDKDKIDFLFSELKGFEGDINRQIPNLSWEELPNKRESRISACYELPACIRKMSNYQTDEQISWAIEQMSLFKKVFPSYIQNLGN